MSKPPSADSPFWKIVHVATRLNVALFRASGGRAGGRIGGAPVLLLHHIGRRSGRARTTPLLYLDDEPNIVVVTSKGGTDTHPAWFHNLMAMDSTEIELPGRRQRRVRPRVAESAERDVRLHLRLAGVHQGSGSGPSACLPGDGVKDCRCASAASTVLRMGRTSCLVEDRR